MDKKTKQEKLNLIKDFVEGRLGIKEFEVIFKSNAEIQSLLKDFHIEYVEDKKQGSTCEYLINKRWAGAITQSLVQDVFHWYLVNEGYKPKYYDYYVRRAQAFSSVYPDWLPDVGSEYIQEHVEDQLPDDMSDTQKKKIIREKIKELFKYENKRPHFEQEGVWPMDKEGKPLIFRSQKSEGDLTTYTFYDPKEDKEVEAHELS